MRKLIFILSVFLTHFILFANAVNVKDFGVNPDGQDCTEGVIKALEHCKKIKAASLVFPKGEYHFGPSGALEKFLNISNNDRGDKKIIFPLEGFKDFQIDGGDSVFYFHGQVNPFWVNASENIAIKNFAVRVGRSFHNEGKILESAEDYYVLAFDEKFDYAVKDGFLRFSSGKSRNKNISFDEFNIPYNETLEFDAIKRETAYLKGDMTAHNNLKAEDLGNRKVKVFYKNANLKAGNILVFSFGRRDYPTMVLDKSKNILVENVLLQGSGGMGIVGQNCENVSVISCKTLPAQGYIVSCTADATHFSNCSGKLILKNNIFQNQKDDATNIHGIYERIGEIISPTKISTELVHAQQFGFDTFKAGDTIEFVKAKSLISLGEVKIKSVEVKNEKWKILSLENPIPEGIVNGDSVAVVGNFAEIIISGNTIGKNRARGILLNGRGKTLVENNTFHNAGAAIMFQGDAFFWFEQGGVNDCTIRNNTFDNCMYGPYGDAVIVVDSGITEDLDKSRYNKNIKVENNLFRIFDESKLIKFYCVDGFVWKNNKIERSSDYPARNIKNPELIKISHFNNVEIKD